MFKRLIDKIKRLLSQTTTPGVATLKPMKYSATITVRRKDGSLKSEREIENGKETFKGDY